MPLLVWTMTASGVWKLSPGSRCQVKSVGFMPMSMREVPE